MARPRRTGLGYFPLDVDFLEDRKVKILKSRFGADGVIFYLYILCEIYRDVGYYMKFNDDFQYLASEDLGMSCEKIGQMLNFLLERSLLNGKLFQSDKVLTSHGIQARYQEAVRERAKKNPVMVDRKLWLLSETETQGFVSYTDCAGYSGKNGSYSGKNEGYSGKNSTKKSKEKESKEKEGMERPHPREGAIPYGKFKNVYLTEEEYQELKDTFRAPAALVNRLSLYKESAGQDYENDFATLLKWAEKDGDVRRPKPKIEEPATPVEAVPMPDDIREMLGGMFKPPE